jgi:hypothetical protein
MNGVSFAGNGGEELGINNFKTTPDEPATKSGGEIKFADNGGGDDVTSVFTTDKRGGLDPATHDTDGGKGVEFTKDLR